MTGEPAVEQRLKTLLDSTEGIREQIRLENIKRDERIKWSRRGVAVAIVAALVGVTVGAISIRQVAQANSDRKQRTVAACLQANEQVSRSIVAAEATSDNFIDYLAAAASANPKTDRAKLRSFVAGAKAAQHAVIEKNYPKRDCSPSGIRKFYTPTTKGRP